ncbi:hypothetical protein [Streptomyces sp. ML-6]|uniref:hypothetical protein n=1 Tax=Streptomyces sp. ML-6 TaxID=2982693 RepID=UPI0024C0425C|nr:hypothetical protein [Streptomyces sp. ML-6]MDK0520903.1 hypothetical protein [Streptomyces sp. ML-6]
MLKQTIAVVLAVSMGVFAFSYSIEAGIGYVGALVLEACKEIARSKEDSEH